MAHSHVRVSVTLTSGYVTKRLEISVHEKLQAREGEEFSKTLPYPTNDFTAAST